FDSEEVSALSVVAKKVPATPGGGAQITAYAERLSRIPGVGRVDALTGSFTDGREVAAPNRTSRRFGAAGATWFSVVPTVEPLSPAGERLVGDLRSAGSP